MSDTDCLIAAAVRDVIARFGITSCSGEAEDFDRGYVFGVHAVLDGLRKAIGEAVLEERP